MILDALMGVGSLAAGTTLTARGVGNEKSVRTMRVQVVLLPM